jgi:Sulfatase
MTRDNAPTGPRAWTLAGALVALGSAVGLVAFVPDGSLTTRLGLHVWDAGHMLAMGIVAAAWTAATTRRGAPKWYGAPVLMAAIALMVAPADLRGPAQRLHASTGIAGWAYLGALGLAAGLWLCERLGRRAGQARASGLAVVATGVAMAALNHTIVPQRHPGLHLLLAGAALATIAGALRPRVPPRTTVLTVVAHALALLSIAVPAPPRVAALMAGARGCVLFPWLPIAAWDEAVAMHDPAWFRPRTHLVAVPPSADVPRPRAPVVILLTVDALRADALTDPHGAWATPTLRALAEHAVAFTDARAPSSRTLASLSSLFAARHFSQLEWRPQWHAKLGSTLWPTDDGEPRLASRLAEAGVHTINVAAVDYLVDEFGVVPGFAQEIVVAGESGVGPPHEPRWADAASVVDTLIAQLDGAGAAPRGALLYAHLLDAHAPYDRGQPRPDSDVRGHWSAEVAVVDAELARLLVALDAAGLRDRAIVIVTADHGESFGAHGGWAHGTSLYDEVLRIPLVVLVPGVAAAQIDTPVSLVDVAPTILDLFGLPIPGSWMGESLAPALAGQALAPSRPLAFEARPKQALLRADGIKVIRDLEFGTVEVFDVRADPLERYNLYEAEVHATSLGELAEFFAAHEFTAPGYVTPVR